MVYEPDETGTEQINETCLRHFCRILRARAPHDPARDQRARGARFNIVRLFLVGSSVGVDTGSCYNALL